MEIEKLLKHMAWANQGILTKASELPDQALDAYIVNPDWTAREIIRHIASSASWYAWRLLDKGGFSDEDNEKWQKRLDLTEIQPATSRDVLTSISYAKEADALLLEAARLPEGDVHREWQGKMIIRKRSTILSQAVHHATEHRAQLVTVLEFKGFTSINLDSYDLWNYADTIGE